MKCESIFISDVHIGTHNNLKKLNILLNRAEYKNLFLVGDIIDGWQLKKRWRWNKECGKFIETLLKKKEEGVNIIYITGNHDEFLRQFTPFSLYVCHVCDEFVYKDTLIIHGDKFDQLIYKNRFLYVLGDYGYNLLIFFDRILGFKGRLSKTAKKIVKKKVNYLNDFYTVAKKYTKSKKCNRVICGHVHIHEYRLIDDVEYWNCGDWRESSTYIIEDNGFKLM